MPTSATTFSISKAFTPDGVDITLNATSPSLAVIAAIDTGAPFPAGDLALGSFSATATTGAPIELGDSAKNVSFSFNGGTTFNLAVISDPGAVLKALNPDPNLVAGIDLVTGTGATDRFSLLKVTYDIGATAKGTVALGVTGVSVNFGATGSLSGDWDVIHRFGATQSAAGALVDTFSAWRLPRQIQNPGMLKPGTWLIAEISGSITANIGVQAGYNYSWIKQLAVGQLTGDIGVKITAAITASLGFSANGNYALALSRPDATNKIRLAIYKFAKNGWNFALNASVGVQGVLPAGLQNSTDPTDLIKAIFGVQANQLIDDLHLVQKVAAGGSLTDQAADYLVSLGEKVPGVANTIDQFNKGVDIVNNFLSQIGTLGQRTMSQLFALIPTSDKGGAAILTDLTKALTDVQSAAGDPSKIGAIVAGELQGIAFFQTDFGKWLTAVLQDNQVASSLAALKDNAALKSIGAAATATLNLLNGTDLQNLIDYVAKKLNLAAIPPLPSIDSWLKAKIAAFLNKAVPSVVQADLTKIQTEITTIFTKASTYWTEALKAAQKQYEATLVATYESSTTDTAMLDVVFNFDDPNPALATLLQNAIDGDFTKILIDPSITGVTLNTGVLTHGIHRQTHVEFTMPFLDAGSDSATNVVSSLTVKHDEGGRILAYNVKANNDTSSFIAGRSTRDGQMTLIMNLNLPVGVNRSPDFNASFGYSLRAAYADTATQLVVDTLKPLVSTYSLPLLPGDVSNWAIDLDKITEKTPTGHLGQSLFAFDVAIDSSLPEVWLKAPASSKDPAYLILSKRIQERLRALIASVYFSQPNRYDDLARAYPLLVYQSLRSLNTFDINSDDPPKITGATTKDFYWDLDEGHLTALMFDAVSQLAILSNMRSANQILNGLRDKNAQFYTADNLGAVYIAARKKSNSASQLPDLLGTLVNFEFNFIQSVIKAGTDLGAFVASGTTDPTAALKAITNFSAAIVKTFNQGLGNNLFGGQELSLMGSALFTEVTLALAAAINVVVPANAAPLALFSITIPNASAKLSLDDLRSGKFTPDQVFVQQKLASPLASLSKTATLVQ